MTTTYEGPEGSTTTVEPLSREENEEMRDFSFRIALAKYSILRAASQIMDAAESAIDGYMRCHNSYANDPELKELKERIRTVKWSIPVDDYGDRIAEASGGPPVGAWDYASPNDEQRMRMRDQGLDPYDDESFWSLKFVDPIDMYIRKIAELDVQTLEKG